MLLGRHYVIFTQRTETKNRQAKVAVTSINQRCIPLTACVILRLVIAMSMDSVVSWPFLLSQNQNCLRGIFVNLSLYVVTAVPIQIKIS